MDQNDPVNVVANRRGDVLQKYTILKSDHFPGQFLAENQYSMPLHSFVFDNCTQHLLETSRLSK